MSVEWDRIHVWLWSVQSQRDPQGFILSLEKRFLLYAQSWACICQPFIISVCWCLRELLGTWCQVSCVQMNLCHSVCYVVCCGGIQRCSLSRPGLPERYFFFKKESPGDHPAYQTRSVSLISKRAASATYLWSGGHFYQKSKSALHEDLYLGQTHSSTINV